MKNGKMKLSGKSIIWEYAKNFKSNLLLVVVLVLESKGLYYYWGFITFLSMFFKYNFFLCLLQDLQRVQEDVSESLKIAVSDFSKIEKDNVMVFFNTIHPL